MSVLISIGGLDIVEHTIAGQTVVFGLENLICSRVVQNSLGVDTSLVGEGTLYAMLVIIQV